MSIFFCTLINFTQISISRENFKKYVEQIYFVLFLVYLIMILYILCQGIL